MRLRFLIDVVSPLTNPGAPDTPTCIHVKGLPYDRGFATGHIKEAEGIAPGVYRLKLGGGPPYDVVVVLAIPSHAIEVLP